MVINKDLCRSKKRKLVISKIRAKAHYFFKPLILWQEVRRRQERGYTYTEGWEGKKRLPISTGTVQERY
jgi:hypothetical protein